MKPDFKLLADLRAAMEDRGWKLWLRRWRRLLHGWCKPGFWFSRSRAWFVRFFQIFNRFCKISDPDAKIPDLGILGTYLSLPLFFCIFFTLFYLGFYFWSLHLRSNFFCIFILDLNFRFRYFFVVLNNLIKVAFVEFFYIVNVCEILIFFLDVWWHLDAVVVVLDGVCWVGISRVVVEKANRGWHGGIFFFFLISATALGAVADCFDTSRFSATATTVADFFCN